MFDNDNNNIYYNDNNKNDKLWQYDKVPPYFKEVGKNELLFL